MGGRQNCAELRRIAPNCAELRGCHLLEHVGRVGLRLLHRRERADEDRRLRVQRRVELLLRPLRAEVDEVVAEDLRREVEEPLHRLRLDQRARHPHLLRPLPREEHADVAVLLRRLRPRLRRRRLLGRLFRRRLLVKLLPLLLLLEERLRPLAALLDVVLVVRRLARQRHERVVEARRALEVLLGVRLVRHLLEHLLHRLHLGARLRQVLVVADEDAHVVALVVLVLALAQPHDRRRLARRQVHHVLELEVGQLLAELVGVERPEPLAAEVRHRAG